MALSTKTIFFALCAVFVLCAVSSGASDVGFSLELVHRDSPKSPLYDPTESPIQRLEKSLSRTINWSIRLDQSRGSEPFSKVVSGGGDYLMNISIGTPPIEIVAIADTGSDLIWTQCKPCKDCFQQIAPLFDPRKSSTYRDISCAARKCTSLSYTSCDPAQGRICHYVYSYGDQSHTYGNVAVDTVTLNSTSGPPVSFPQTLIGCGHDNSGTFDNQTSGIVGLGGGPESLISQLGKSTGGKFSYCLVPYGSEKSSPLNFGSRAEVKGAGTVSTPLLRDEYKTFYYLTLDAVSVGDTRIDYTGPLISEAGGNIIIDSGTTLTLLPLKLYVQIESEVSKAIPLDQMDKPPIDGLRLCYDTSIQFDPPPITVHFAGKADVKLAALNTFVKVSEDAICFAFAPTNVDVSIYGNVAQMNFLVGHDIINNVVSFKPTDCTKF